MNDEIRKIISQNETLNKERDGLLTQLFDLRELITKKRNDEIRMINSKLIDALNIRLFEKSNTTEYFNNMKKWLSGSYVSKEDIKLFCSKININLKIVVNLQVNVGTGSVTS